MSACNFPAQVLTPTFKQRLLGDPRFGETLRQRLVAGIPLNRLLEPKALRDNLSKPWQEAFVFDKWSYAVA